MKRVDFVGVARLLSVAIGFVSFLVACGDGESVSYSPASELYPIDRVISDSQGRELNVVITGRTSDSVFFLRKSDEKKFEYKIVSLSMKDREFVKGLPLWAPAEPELVVTDRVQKRLDDFESQIRRLALEHEKSGTTTAQKQNIRREVDELKDEVIELIMDEELDVREIQSWMRDVLSECGGGCFN